MKKKLILWGTVWIACQAGAQNAPSLWTLKQCVDYAVQHSIEVKQGQNRIGMLGVERSSLRSSLLPELTAGASQQFTFGRSLTQNNTYENSDIQNTSFSIGMELPLSSCFRTSALLAQNRYDRLASEADQEIIRNNLALQVTSAYFQILLNKEICRIAEEQIGLTREQQERTAVLVQHGKVPQSQLYEVKAQLADDELAAMEARNTLRLSKLDLLQLMERNADEEFDVDSLGVETGYEIGYTSSGIYESAIQCMPQIRKAQYEIRSGEQAVRAARTGYYPTLSMGAGLSSGYYHVGGGWNDSFRNQFRNNLQKSLYFTLSIPLFDRHATRNQVRNARLEIVEAQLAYEKEKKTLCKEIEKAWLDAAAAREKLESTQRAVEANREAHRYAKEKYAAGKSTVYEYNEIKVKLADALSRQSQAKYTYLLKMKLLAFYACRPLTE